MNGISNSAINSAASQARITGLSGFDTETMISQLMQAEKIPLNGLNQKRTRVQWKQEAYRDVTNTLNGFKSSFFDIVNRSTYMLSENSVKAMKASSSSSSYLDVSATTDAQAGSYNVKVLQIATADTATTQTKLSKDITGLVSGMNLAGTKIRVTLDGVAKDIALENYTADNIASKLQTSLDTAFGDGKINVGFNSGKLTIGTAGGATKVSVSDPTSGSVSGLAGLGLASGDSNRIALTSTLAALKDKFNIPLTFSGGGTVDLTINGKLISADATDSLSEVLDRINNTADANVTVKYDELTDKISISSKQLGDGDNLKMENINGNFLAALGINMADPVTQDGQDAKINGDQEVVRSTNNFTLNGITYNLKSAHPVSSDGDTITVEQDVDTAYNNIKSFIDKYNELIGKLNGKTNEEYDRNYLPLTDDQRKSMSDTDITSWEKKAKTGLLQNDDILRKIVQDMRTALYEPVDGTSLTLKDLGISSTSYQDEGKLYIDENKLKDALKNKPDEVAKLLNGVDPNNPSYSRTATSAERESRYQKSGLFQRISDIVDDNTSTIRDSNVNKDGSLGNKGILLEKAGIDGDMSFTNNLMDDELDAYDQKISSMQDKIDAVQERYYTQFSAMESYLSQMNAQSSWLAQQFGTSTSS